MDDEHKPGPDDNTINEPNFIWNENNYTSWGKCYFKALQDDKVFGEGKTIHHPLCRNKNGFVLKRYPSKGQNRVYISDGRCMIGGEFYPIRPLLMHYVHHRLVHYVVSKTYRDISKDTSWPEQWKETKRFVKRCHTCQIIKKRTQCPSGNAQLMQVRERPCYSISMNVLGSFPTYKGFEYRLVVVDRFSPLV